MDSDPKDIVRTGYDAISYLYRPDDAAPVDHMTWANQLVEILRLRTTEGHRDAHGARVLDLGCGCGVPVSRVLARAGHHVVGVDFSAVQVERAKKLIPEGDFFRADITELVKGTAELEVQEAVLNGGKFDAVTAFYVLIHLPIEEQAALMGQLGNWVKPGGYWMMTVGITAWTGEVKEWFEGNPDSRMWWSQTSVDNYRKWAEGGGFEIVRDEHIPDLRTHSEGHQLLLLKKRM